MSVRTVYVVFKTHLDVGFTDLAANVTERYFTDFIPRAIQLARRLNADSDTPKFRWTVGSWLIYEFMERTAASERKLMEQAIERGDLAWHALPFTLHSELLDTSLFRFGLSLSQALDARFGKQTIAAKMTDVPGHTRGIVPLLAEANVEFLHIGVNPASSPPDVPPLFTWRDEATDSQITVMYHTIYGDVTILPGGEEAIALVLTGDNLGPPTQQQVEDTYTDLQRRFPDAEIRAATLNDYALKLRSTRDSLPVITAEIGDTWIHGAGTDPTKVSRYRDLVRLRAKWLDETPSLAEHPAFKAFSRALLMIPEHTWGLDEKAHLRDHEHYTLDELAAVRDQTHFRHFASSWQEQRDYITSALKALESLPDLYHTAQAHLKAGKPCLSALSKSRNIKPLPVQTAHFEINWNAETGALNHLVARQSGKVWADSQHELARFSYHLFSREDYDRYWSQYIRDTPENYRWAYEDNVKPGMPDYPSQLWTSAATQAYWQHTEYGDRLLLNLSMPAETDQYGLPRQLYLGYTFPAAEPRIDITLNWFNKQANRLPEAFWLSFQPLVAHPENWRLEKLGGLIDPRNVVSRGGRGLHASNTGAYYSDDQHTLHFQSIDAPLFAPGRPALLDFTDALPDLAGGWHINLYNNVWGTNFPMWFEDDTQFRFSLRFGTAAR
jgi:hypothetical protein